MAEAAWPPTRTVLTHEAVVTIAETPGFCASGGMLNLYEEGNRIRFEANPAAAAAAGLTLRADLLKLAKIVRTGEP